MRYVILPRPFEAHILNGPFLLTRWIPPFPVTGDWGHIESLTLFAPDHYRVSRLLRDEMFYRGVFPVA